MKRLLFGVLAILTLAALGGQWIAPVPFEYAAALGRNGSSPVHKFGQSADVDSGEFTIYEGAAYGGPDRAAANQSGPFTLYVSSANALDTMSFEIQGLAGTTWESQTATVTLAGQTKTEVTGVTWERVFRAKPASDLNGVVYLYIDDTVTNGVPDTPATKLITVVTDTENQTMHNHWTVPAGFSYLLSNWCVSNLTNAQADTKRFRIRTMYPQGTASRTQRSMEYADGDGDCLPIDPPIRFLATADIELTAEGPSDTGTQPVTGNFDGVLIPD